MKTLKLKCQLIWHILRHSRLVRNCKTGTNYLRIARCWDATNARPGYSEVYYKPRNTSGLETPFFVRDAEEFRIKFEVLES